MINKNIVRVIIPARGGSKRLEKKNIFSVWGKPMIYWAISACKQSKYIDSIHVSTENELIKRIAKQYDVDVIDRPEYLARDDVYKQDVITHAFNTLQERGIGADIVISLQANSPEIKYQHLDSALEKFEKFERNELISVNFQGIQNAAFRIMRGDYVFQKSLSTKCGFFMCDYVDVHTLEDVKKLEERCYGR